MLWRSADAQRHPILLVRVGRALQLVKPERIQEFMDTILSQVRCSGVLLLGCEPCRCGVRARGMREFMDAIYSHTCAVWVCTVWVWCLGERMQEFMDDILS